LFHKEYLDTHGIDKYKRKMFGCGRNRIKYSKNKIDNEIYRDKERLNGKEKEKKMLPQGLRSIDREVEF
jgi:hypothetical protein